MSRSINLNMCYRWLAWKVILKKQDTKQLKCVVFSLLLSISCNNMWTCCCSALVSPLIVIALRWAPRCDLWSWSIDPLITGGQFMTCECTLNQRLRMSPNPLRLKSGEAEMIAKMSHYVCRMSREGGSGIQADEGSPEWFRCSGLRSQLSCTVTVWFLHQCRNIMNSVCYAEVNTEANFLLSPLSTTTLTPPHSWYLQSCRLVIKTACRLLDDSPASPL